MNGILTLDIGTSSLRASLHDETGKVLAVDQRASLPRYHPDGRVEQDAEVWTRLVPEVLATVAARAAEARVKVAAIALTAQRSSVIPVDAEGRALRPAIMWQDLRTAPLAAGLASSQALVHAKTGLRIHTVFSALKMLWLRREEPGTFARTARMLGIQDYVLHFLTGRFVTDESLASRTNLLDLETRTWDPGMCELFEVEPSMLCELIPPGSVAGGLLPGPAAAIGLPPGTPVVSAGGDQQCAALGLGLFSGERAVANTGTGSYLIGHSDRPLHDPLMRVSCNVSALPGAYFVEAALPTSGSIYRWLSETLGTGTGEDPFGGLNALAEGSEPGAHGLVLVPHFNGAGTPSWDPGARGLFYNLSLATTRGDLARATLEGIATELGAGLSLLEELCAPVSEVSVSGGLSRFALFCGIQADVFGRPTLRYEGGEATSLGAWMGGAVATGLAPSYAAAFARAAAGMALARHEPDPDRRALYAGLRERSRALYEALAEPATRRILSRNVEGRRT